MIDRPASELAAVGERSESGAGGLIYKRYALGVLTAVYALSMLDRQIVTILAEPIKAELGLADWQLGALSGLAFALFYTLLGIPIARLADRGDRVRIISVAIALWSAFTVLCGLVSSFPLLLLARLGVGVGEAGGTPPAHSLITEFTPRERRASAFSVYALGVPLGSLAGLGLGGLVADAYGWRIAFIAAGAPGLALAVVAALTLKEPRRLPRLKTTADVQPPLRDVLKELRSQPAFVWVSMGVAVSAFAFYGQNAFYGSLFLRAHKAEVAALAELAGLGPGGLVGLALGGAIGVASAAGALLGGPLADRLGRGTVAGYIRVPALAMLTSAPLFAALPLASGAGLTLLLLTVAVFLQSMAFGPCFAAVQTLVRPTSRAMAVAVLLFLANLVGLGLGPLSIGWLSDTLNVWVVEPNGLRWAMAGASVAFVVAGGCYLRALHSRPDDTSDGVSQPSDQHV